MGHPVQCTSYVNLINMKNDTLKIQLCLLMMFADRCQVGTGRTVSLWQIQVKVEVAVFQQQQRWQKALLVPLSHLHFAALESDIVVLTV